VCGQGARVARVRARVWAGRVCAEGEGPCVGRDRVVRVRSGCRSGSSMARGRVVGVVVG
jgi:hypothetical protein